MVVSEVVHRRLESEIGYERTLVCPGCYGHWNYDGGMASLSRSGLLYCTDECRRLGPFEKRSKKQQAEDREGWI